MEMNWRVLIEGNNGNETPVAEFVMGEAADWFAQNYIAGDSETVLNVRRINDGASRGRYREGVRLPLRP